MSSIMIIGTGLAGYNLAREFRKLDKDASLTLLTEDDGHFYSKPMLSNGFAKNKTAAELAMSDTDKMRRDLNAGILTQTRVERIEADLQQLHTSDGQTLRFDKLVFASGARPIQVPMQGDALDYIYSVNNLADYARLRSALEGKQSVAMIGPGLIGCEFANDLAAAGFKVTVIGPDQAPLGRLVPSAAGEKLKAALTQLGIEWQLETVVESIERHHDQLKLRLQNNSEVSADVVLSAIGLKPDTALASAAGIATQRGIVVDRYLQTSAANIYALGDCAEVSGLVLPYVLPLMQGARCLAKTLAGTPTEVSYPAMPVAVKTPAHAVIVSPPARDAIGEWDIEENDNGVKALFKNDDALLGFVLTGDFVAEKQALTKLLPAVLV